MKQNVIAHLHHPILVFFRHLLKIYLLHLKMMFLEVIPEDNPKLILIHCIQHRKLVNICNRNRKLNLKKEVYRENLHFLFRKMKKKKKMKKK